MVINWVKVSRSVERSLEKVSICEQAGLTCRVDPAVSGEGETQLYVDLLSKSCGVTGAGGKSVCLSKMCCSARIHESERKQSTSQEGSFLLRVSLAYFLHLHLYFKSVFIFKITSGECISRVLDDFSGALIHQEKLNRALHCLRKLGEGGRPGFVSHKTVRKAWNAAGLS